MKKLDAWGRLEAFAGRLREQLPAELDEHATVPLGVWVSLEDAVWLEKAIRHVTETGSSLEQALGLRGSPGAPRGLGNVLIADAFAENLDATQAAIADRAQEKHPDVFPDGVDERTVRRALFKQKDVLTTEAVEAVAKKLTTRLEKAQGQK